MPMRGDFAKFTRFAKEMKALGTPGTAAQNAILAQVKNEVQGRLKEQFRRGVGPDDVAHRRTKKGQPALVSNRLGAGIRARAHMTALWVEGKTDHLNDILDTHQDGHTFPSRDGKVTQYRDRKGRMISYTKFLRRVRDTEIRHYRSRSGSLESDYVRTSKKGKQSIIASRSLVGDVKFGPRKLPQRPIRPVRVLTRPWQAAIYQGYSRAFGQRLKRITP